MSPHTNKSGIKSYCSNEISHNFKLEGYVFKSVKGILYITVICSLVFLSSLLIKIFVMCYIWGHCSYEKLWKSEIPHTTFWLVFWVFGSNFKVVKFLIYPNHMLKEDTHKNYIVQWMAKVSACSTNFWIFLITLYQLNVAWCYKVVTNFRQIIVLGEDGTCK